MKRGLLVLAALLVTAPLGAQRVDPKRPRTLVVGTPRGAAPMDRVDARRSGLASTQLPSGRLRVAWKRSLNFTIAHAPLVGANGDVTLIASRGDVITLDTNDGTERAHTAVGSAAISAGAILSDGTVVFLDGSNEAVGVTLGGVRFKTRLAGDRASTNAKLAPIALEDGGVVIASTSEIATLDADGNVRARTTMREAVTGPLLAARGSVIAVTTSGAVYAWSPSASAREPVRVGSFGGAVDGSAALEGDHTLVAVVDGTQLVELDLARGAIATRASAATAGVSYFLGPPALHGEGATLLALTPTRTFLLTLDASGQEKGRQGVALSAPTALPDGGAPVLAIPPHAGPIADARGALAFAAPDAQAGGQVGIVSAGGALDTLGEALCESSAGSAARGRGIFAGIAPAGAGAFIVACESGYVGKVVGD